MPNENKFLLKEYEMCYEQLRFYDSRNSSLLRYLFTLTSAVATAQFAIYKINKSFDDFFFVCQAFLSVVVLIASILLYMMMLQNRLYFVFIARQINAIRKFLLENSSPEFTENQLYTSTNFPALKPRSVHTFQLIGASSLCGLYSGSFIFSIVNSTQICNSSLLISTIVSLVVTLVFSLGGAGYLSKMGNKSADKAIHGQ